jgi:drug/metabolite transporter (DMT)-like permease
MSAPFRGLIWDDPDAPGDAPRPTRTAIFMLLGAAVLILGLNWPIMAFTLESVTPIWMAAARVSGAAVVMFLVGLGRRSLVTPPRPDVPMVISVAIFRLSAVMVLVFFALRLVPSGRASVLVWTTSLWTVPLAAVFLRERMTTRKWTGLGIGVAGIVLLSEIWRNDWEDTSVIVGTGLLLLAAITSAATAVHIRRHKWTIDPLQAAPWQLAGAAIPLVTLGLIVDGPPTWTWTLGLVGALLYQAVLASGLAFWAQIVVLRNLSAVTTNLTMTGVPVLGVVSSAVVLDEPITFSLAVGMALIITGVVVNLLGDRATQTAPAPTRDTGPG